MILLTKSKYLAGLQCPRYLWTLVHDSGKIPEADASTQFLFDQGTKVGKLAKKWFPDGIDISTDDFKENIQKSKELLSKGKPLFEAGFMFNNCFSRVDILVPNGSSWDIVEVKSGTKVKEVNIHDVAFQKYCYEGNGIKIGKCYLMHINNEYERKGELDIKQLFVKDDITSEVNEAIKGLEERIDSIFKIINSDKYPTVTIGPQCKNPYDCPISECWDFLPENHVFHLYRGGKKSLQLFEEGIHAISDIPDGFELNTKQNIQRECEKTGDIYVDKRKIKKFLDNLEYPLYYLDFETFGTAIPMFDGLKPHQQVPFQFSLHTIESEDAEPKHISFLYLGKEDPRKEFISELEKVLGGKGSIIVYNQSFEKNILYKLGKAFPEYQKWIDSLNPRFVDLLIPFRNFAYYSPAQKGSASLKVILPALTGKGYDGMEITDGTTASVEFYNITYKPASKEQIEKVRTNLKKYCGLDTEGMIWIIDKLRKLID